MAWQVQLGAVRTVSLLAVFLACSGQAQAADVAQPLTAAEIRATLIGNTVQNIVQGVPATTYFGPDGTKRFHSMRMNDGGTWRIVRHGTDRG